MKKILLITLTLLMVVTSFATTPSLLNEWNWKPKPKNENVNLGTVTLISGLMITSIGLIREITREPFPNHSTNINYNPNAPQPLNLILMGAGVGLSGYGIKMMFTF